MTRRIDANRCTLCGMCRAVCGSGLMEPTGEGEARRMRFVDAADEYCFFCGHCIAACPEEAITIDELSDTAFPLLPEEGIGYEEFQALLLSRRSVRRFEERPVEREVVDRLLASVSTAPAGGGADPSPVVVLHGREKIEPYVPRMAHFFRKFQHALKNPIMRPIMRLSLGRDQYRAMIDFLPIMEKLFAYYDGTGKDPFTWGAPLLLIFHGPRSGISPREDAVIACTYAMLSAQAQGLGTTMIGMAPPFLERTPAARRDLKIPEGNGVYLSLIVGYPKVRFVRGIRRPVDATWI